MEQQQQNNLQSEELEDKDKDIYEEIEKDSKSLQIEKDYLEYIEQDQYIDPDIDPEDQNKPKGKKQGSPVHEAKCENELKSEVFEPTEHQIKARDYFLKTPYKGMLLYHKLGSGKTCTAILIAISMLEKKDNPVKHVYVLTPGSLRYGWFFEYCNKCGKDGNFFKKNFTFITYNYTLVHTKLDFQNCLVIIDEAHNIMNGVSNLSANFVFLYNELLTQNCKILALSGTPIYNNITEFALMLKLLKKEKDINGNDVPVKKITPAILEECFKSFAEIFMSEGVVKIKNKTHIKRQLEGLVSYFKGAGEEYVPRVIEMEPIKVYMSEEQNKQYWFEYYRENSILTSQVNVNALVEKGILTPEEKLKRKKLKVMAKKRILSRKVSNFYYPKEVPNEIPDTLDTTIPVAGWINKETTFQNQKLLKFYSSKITALLLNITINLYSGKHLIFTFFKTKSGAILIKTLLSMCGITSEIFSGDLKDDKKRKAILDSFNSPKNIKGDLIKVLIVTEAGAEGINVLEVRHMHILESSPRVNKTIQAIGRVARFKSHMRLNPSERNVKIWRYWSVSNLKIEVIDYEDSKGNPKKMVAPPYTGLETERTMCVDEMFANQGKKSLDVIKSFLELLEKYSIENTKK